MVEQVEVEGPEVEERGYEAPVLFQCQYMRKMHRVEVETYLTPHKDGPEAVEQLKGRDNVALHQHACTEGGGHPPARAYGHLVEPLLERKLAHHAVAACQDVRHCVVGSVCLEGFRSGCC